MWDQLLQAVLPVLIIIAKGLAAATVFGALAQLTVESIVAPVALNTPVLPTSVGGIVGKRLAVLLVAQAAVTAAHGLGIWTYGEGAKGYGAAWFFGFLGGGLTPVVHNLIKRKADEAGKP